MGKQGKQSRNGVSIKQFQRLKETMAKEVLFIPDNRGICTAQLTKFTQFTLHFL